MLDRIFLGSGDSKTGWFNFLGVGQATPPRANAVALDTNGNVYVCGSSAGTGGDIQLVKYNSLGAIEWQVRLGLTSTDVGNSVAVDSSANVYVCGYYTNVGRLYLTTAKYNTSGTLQWQRSLNFSIDDAVGQGIAVDSSANVYVCGYFGSSSSDWIIAKYNTSGTLQWQRSANGAGETARAISVEPTSGDVYVCGDGPGTSGNQIYVAKLNTSGTLQWQRQLGDSFSDEIGYGIALDSSANVYVSGTDIVSGGNVIQIAKYSSSGTIQWQRKLTNTSGAYADGTSIAVDSSGNCYVCGYTTPSVVSPVNSIQIAKYNTSGTIQWQRSINQSGGNGGRGQGIAVDAVGNMYIAGYFGGYMFTAKLPDDGTLTGTYSSTSASIWFDYSASSLTAATSTLTDAAGSLSFATSTLTAATPTLTANTSSFTLATVTA